MDKITESIAHFIGLFELTLEEARLREAYEPADTIRTSVADAPELPHVKIDVATSYSLIDYVPSIPYVPVLPTLEGLMSLPVVTAGPLPYHWTWPGAASLPPIPLRAETVETVHSSASLAAPPPQPEPAGSVIFTALQKTFLVDDDYVAVGDHGLVFHGLGDPTGSLLSLVSDASLLPAITTAEPPATEGAIRETILTFAPAVHDMAQSLDNPDMQVYANFAPELEGTTVNGLAADKLPSLKDYLPKVTPAAATDAGDDPVHHATIDLTRGPGEAGSLDLHMGGNLLVNTAGLTTAGLQAPVFAVMGDYVESNVIVQMNAWSDSDQIGQSIQSFGGTSMSAATKGFNIASFDRIALGPEASDAKGGASQSLLGAMPNHWRVDTVEGNLVFMNWVKQFNFISDNDIAIYASTGAHTNLAMGGNTGMDGISFADLGNYYDLVIVGGSIFEANFISQVNVLLDDDFLAGIGGFKTTGAGHVSTGGNLLWNEANITNIGGAHRFEALPDIYKTLAEGFGAKEGAMPAGLGSNPAWAGLEGLHVLYIAGDVLDLSMISQTNVLGDSDQVSLVRGRFDAATGGPTVTISTGSNALINKASILDVDSAGGKTMLGGDHYSDEILFQAELVAPGHALDPGANPDALAYEAIAFLDHPGAASLDTETVGGKPSDALANHHADVGSHDVMHTMLS